MRNINIANKQKPVTLKVNGIEVGKINLVGSNASKFQMFKHKTGLITKRLLKVSAITVSVAWIATGALHIGMLKAPTVYAEKEVIKEVRVMPPILQKIIKCESGNTHYDKSGQVLTRANTNKTVDTGIAQINTVWHKKATDLGLDITKESDNLKMAQYIFDNHGSEPWYSSKSCWSK